MEKIRVNAIIEIGGFPKEHIEKTMDNIVENLKKAKNLKVLKSEVEKPIERKGIWLTLAELEILFDDFNVLTSFCFSHLPTSVEIIEPSKIEFQANEITTIISDLIAKLNIYDDSLKKLIIQNKVLMNQVKKDQ